VGRGEEREASEGRADLWSLEVLFLVGRALASCKLNVGIRSAIPLLHGDFDEIGYLVEGHRSFLRNILLRFRRCNRL
jgi:hypothetical protein